MQNNYYFKCTWIGVTQGILGENIKLIKLFKTFSNSKDPISQIVCGKGRTPLLLAIQYGSHNAIYTQSIFHIVNTKSFFFQKIERGFKQVGYDNILHS